MGWNNGTLAGIPAIWHDGAEPNVYTRLLIEPQTYWGVILLVNANNFIPVDGANSALTSLGAGVTRLLAGQAPQASLSLTTFYLIFDGVLAVLLALAIFPLLRLRRWSRRFGQRRHASRAPWPATRMGGRPARSPLVGRPAGRQYVGRDELV